MLAHARFTDFSSSFRVDLTTLISCLNSHVSSEICVCRLEKLSSMRDSMAINLSRSISIEMSESVSWFASISSPFCLFRFVVGLSAELELDERSERFNMRTSSKQQLFQIPAVLMLKRYHWLHLSELKWPGMTLLN